MVNPSYQKGYRFERRIIKHLESEGYFVVRSGKSKFPDIVALKFDYRKPGNIDVVIGECKVNKYLSKGERTMAILIKKITGVPLTVYWRDGRKIARYVYPPWPQ